MSSSAFGSEMIRVILSGLTGQALWLCQFEEAAMELCGGESGIALRLYLARDLVQSLPILGFCRWAYRHMRHTDPNIYLR
jgi:hypothetical protein